AEFGDLSIMPTLEYWYGLQPDQEHVIYLDKGVYVLFGLQAIGAPDAKAIRTVMCRMNGQIRPIRVLDRSIQPDVPNAERADPNHPGHVAAPYSGAVTVTVKVGDEVAVGDKVATIEAMKMEAAINAPVAGTVERVVFADVAPINGGELVLVITPAE
ncbi:MAG: pyruvate carboxylase, partial [Propionibacterium sp.]